LLGFPLGNIGKKKKKKKRRLGLGRQSWIYLYLGRKKKAEQKKKLKKNWGAITQNGRSLYFVKTPPFASI
jgi:hypothetical protein